MKTTTTTALALLTTAALAGCGSFIHEGPTNQEIKDRTGLTVAEASQVVTHNFGLIWPEPVPIDIEKVTILGKGCRTDPNSLLSQGPPWHPTYEMEKVDPTPEFIARAMANLEAMTARGFTLEPSRRPDEDPVNRYYSDARGFSVASSRLTDVGRAKEVRFSMSASSPCAAE